MENTSTVLSTNRGLPERQRGNVFAPEVLDYLFAETKESAEWDFKKTVSIATESDFHKTGKDIFAFTNYGGGYILIGWEERETGGFDPVGVPADFHIDQASLQGKFNACSSLSIELQYTEVFRNINDETKRFALLYVPPSPEVVVPTKDGAYLDADGKKRTAFLKDTVYIRRVTQSVPAEPHELAWIERRIKDDDFQIGFLAGKADSIQESLHSNLFPVTSLPRFVYSAGVKGASLPRGASRIFPCVSRAGHLYSFHDPRETPLKEFIYPNSVRRFPRTEWRSDQDRDRIFIWLLKEYVKAAGRAKGMYSYDKFDRLYFPLREGEKERTAYWRGLKRKSTRYVVNRMTAVQLGRDVNLHHAFEIDILRFDNNLFLQIVPTFVVTDDGSNPTRDEGVGSVITKLLYDKYNGVYLRDVAFWINQLQTTPGTIRVAADEFEISTTPLTAEVDRGILSDRIEPTEEGFFVTTSIQGGGDAK